MSTQIKQCRNCRKEIHESHTAYAYDPVTKKPAKWNFYGGWVCSEQCDKQACLDMESSFPGAGRATSLSSCAKQQVDKNWKALKDSNGYISRGVMPRFS